MAQAEKPTNEQIVRMLESVLHDLSELKSDIAKLTKTS